MNQKSLLLALLSAALLAVPSCSDKNATEPLDHIELTIKGVFEDIGYMRIDVTYDPEGSSCGPFSSNCGEARDVTYYGPAEFSSCQNSGLVAETLDVLSGKNLGVRLSHYPKRRSCAPFPGAEFIFSGTIQVFDPEQDPVTEVWELYFVTEYSGTLDADGCPQPLRWGTAHGYARMLRRIGDVVEMTVCQRATVEVRGMTR